MDRAFILLVTLVVISLSIGVCAIKQTSKAQTLEVAKIILAKV